MSWMLPHSSNCFTKCRLTACHKFTEVNEQPMSNSCNAWHLLPDISSSNTCLLPMVKQGARQGPLPTGVTVVSGFCLLDLLAEACMADLGLGGARPPKIPAHHCCMACLAWHAISHCHMYMQAMLSHCLGSLACFDHSIALFVAATIVCTLACLPV